MPKSFQAIIGILSLVILLLMGTAVIDSIAEGESGIRLEQNEPVLLEPAGQYTQINDASGYDETVYNSLGNAVVLAGTDDSYVQSDSNIDFATDENWTVSVWASLDSNAALQQRTVISLNGRLVLTYYPMAGNWSAWYYDDGSTNSHRVNVSVSGGAQPLQNIIIRSNSTHLGIYRNNTAGDIKNITADNIADAPISSANWHGRLEEFRTFDDDIDNSQRQQLVDEPVAPLPSANRTSRVMFDEANKSTQLIFFTSAELTQSNVTFDNGHPGKEMDGKNLINDITGSTDYVWDTNGPRIYVVEGGELDGAPVAYIDFSLEEALSDMIRGWTDFAAMAALIPLLVISVLLFGKVRAAG